MYEREERHLTPTISVDFQNADEKGRVRLNIRGTESDVERLGVRFTNGMRVRLTDGELEADGEVMYSEEEEIWVARINWREIRDV